MPEPDEQPASSQDTTEAEVTTAASSDESDLQRQAEEARARADENYRSWQRTAADFANFKRRVDEEKRFAERWLIQDLLPVLDDFERAWASAPREMVKFSWVEGLVHIHSKLAAVLERRGVSPIETQGKQFSPLEHEAVMREDDSDPSEQTAVVAELQRGYRLHDRVLRPALVKVGKPPAAVADTAENAPSAANDAGAAETAQS